MQNVMPSRPRLLWGDRINLFILMVFQVLAVIILVSVPLLINGWLQDYPEFSLGDRWTFLYLPYLLGFAYLISGIWVFSLRRNDSVGQVFSLLSTSVAIGLFCLFPVVSTQRLIALWSFSISLSGGALINLALIFPEEGQVSFHYPFLRYLGYLPSGLLFLIAIFIQVYADSTGGFGVILFLEAVFIVLALLFFLGSTFVRRIDSPSPLVREQARLILWGSGIAFAPLLVWLSINAIQPAIRFSPYLLLPITTFPVVLGYVILRYRLLNMQFLLNRGLSFGLLLLIVSTGYALLVSGANLILADLIEINQPLLIGVIVFLIALSFNPLHRSMRSRVEGMFFRGKENYQDRLQDFGHELTQLTNLEEIVSLLNKYVDRDLSPSRIFVYLIDEHNLFFLAAHDEVGRPTSDVHFAKNGALAQLLAQREATLFLADESRLPEELQVDQARLAILGAQLFVPILGRAGMVGWLALGSRLSGEPYSIQAVNFLESLCDRASLALERSHVIAALERRVHEMDTITRVAEGINLQLSFGEMLEMFYTQTRNLISTVDFRITLKDEPEGNFHHVFYIANGERFPNRETYSPIVNQSLEAETIRNRQSIVTIDYVGECTRRGISPDENAIHAWMSVPLNAGTDTIGAVSLGSRDLSVRYTGDQVELLQAIADLVAGAIIKSRLLDESQKRTRQMATLNEITRSLTSTLELDPLLNRILGSAVEILDCEAGSLLLIDEQTGELVFEVAIGPVGADLEGQRLPPGVGLVGKAVTTKQAIIQNDVRRSEDWFNADKDTGFSTKDLMVVPLVVKGIVIGVLEILNKEDRSPFNLKDLELLTAFAGQAVVAIENARLYTQTDQALAARVDELSVMQRIDRELNASLDIDRVMRIMLEWSILRSKANSGLIGLVEDDALKVVSTQGYSDDLLDDELPQFLSELHAVFDTGKTLSPKKGLEGPETSSTLSDDSNQTGDGLSALLSGSQSRIVIPIRRDSQVIAFLFLESISSSCFTDDVHAFLSRLSDHAAIALSNAQLYGEVQKANLVKSQFVSAAAHELKNPLTSIRGYSDLLLRGSVGPINEAQTRFLATVRSNAQRMGTLVSDLQDISRIEANQLHLEFANRSLVDITSEVASSLKKEIEAKEQTLDIDLPAGLPDVWCDNTRMIQILTNLVSNAHKYSPPGGRIVISGEQVNNCWDLEGAEWVLHLTVSDTGLGISQEDQKIIFQQFFRSEDPRVRESTGTGLGLSITKRLVEMQGGQIWFESELNRGTIFHFTIPVSEHN